MADREHRKNIVLCSDGTGQTGARVGGTNVWKIRMGVDRHDHLEDPSRRRQIVFYDAGVGTSALSLKAALGSAFGYGLSANIRQLYKNLAKNYRDGDRIWAFGFSRGAFTARSLAGMIAEVGVIDGRRDNEELEQLVKEAYDAYRSSPRNRPIEKFQQECTKKGITILHAPIHFVGVWDTVDAYGMPIDELRVLIYDKILNKLRRPHNDGITGKMKYAYQALAIDEDRHTFTPTLYDEDRAREHGVTVEQVWFAGAHSNVGGGYPRQGLSDVALDWMMTKAEQATGDEEKGLRFTKGSRKDVRRDMDGNSTLYDQRSGPGVIWRYLPRDIGKLCRAANTPPRIHVSAMDRIELATADYAPITLPIDFEVVGTGTLDKERAERFNACQSQTRTLRESAVAPAWREIEKRRWLYRVFLIALILVAALVFSLWRWPDGTVAEYRKYSVLTKFGIWLGGQLEGLGGFAVETWSVLEKIALAVVPGGPDGLPDQLVKAVLKLPEGVIAIVLLAFSLMIWKQRLVARMKHLGLDLWRRCFEP